MARRSITRPSSALVLFACALAATVAHAQDLVPSPLPPIDPDRAAHLVLIDEAPAGPRAYAIDGRFAGDLDGDGDDDLLVPGATDAVLHLVLGGPRSDFAQERRGSAGDARLLLPAGCRLGDGRIHWAGVGDLNGDTRDDVAVACFDWEGSLGADAARGAVALYFGRAVFPATTAAPDVLLQGEPVLFDGATGAPVAGVRPGASVSGPGDLDGDGVDDLLVTAAYPADPFRPLAYLFLGSSDFSSAVSTVSDATWLLRGEDGVECVAPLLAAAPGDVDGDDLADLALACVAPTVDSVIDTAYSVFLGADVSALPPGPFGYGARAFVVQPSEQLVPHAGPLSGLGDLDGDGYDEFAVVSWVDGISAVSARLVAGHPGPWQDIGFLDLWWLEETGQLDPYAPFLPSGSYDSIDGLLVAAAGDQDGDAQGDLFVRIGPDPSPFIGLLTSPRPATWAEGAVPPLVGTFSTATGIANDGEARFGLGGSGDFNGDGVRDLLVTSGFADGDGCTAELCGGAFLVLCVDGDEDGVSACAGDCDDRDAARFPEATELCDPVDQDCDGNDGSVDGDGDDVLVCDGDCDDSDPARFPGAEETCDGVLDLDCDGLTPAEDQDVDGSLNCEDCQPFLATMAPALAETCDGLDNDCDGALPRDEQDVDRDGFVACAGGLRPVDCDDGDALVRPLRFEDCFNGLDDNCDGRIDEDFDADGDGVGTCDGDCDDQRGDVYPGGTELCDGRDNNCNGVVDDDRDDDGDGVGTCAGDCDDADAQRFPGNAGRCAGEGGGDADCDGTSDLLDEDGDGASACGGDCAEGDAGISPLAPERCDRRDNDCDGVVDEAFDGDLDGWALCHGDCNDTAELVFPQVREPTCTDAVDGDCDGAADGSDPDCVEDAPPPAPAPRAYGLACASSQPAGGAPACLGVLALAALLFLPRRRPTWGPLAGVILLGALIVAPDRAEAGKREKGLIVYLSPQPDVSAMQRSKGYVEVLEAEEILHVSELLPAARGLLAVGSRKTPPCEGPPARLGDSATGALDALIELDYKRVVKVADAAVAALPCADSALPPRLLPDLFYYRALARAAMSDPNGARGDFVEVVALAPDYPADPNFDPASNAVLEEVRAAGAGSEGTLAAYVPPGASLRVDGRDVDADAGPWPLRAGLHVGQLRFGRSTDTVVFSVEAGREVVLVRADDRLRALRDAPLDAGARAFARTALLKGANSAEVDLVALVDLDVASEHLRYVLRASERRFSFEGDLFAGGSAERVSGGTGGGATGGATPSRSRGGTSRTSGRVQSGAGEDGTNLRARASVGFALTRPFPYLQVPVDLGVRLVRGLHLDVALAVATPGPTDAGAVLLPTVAFGLSYRIPVSALEPRLGGGVQIGLDDRDGSIGPLPGWFGLVGFDVLVPRTPLLVGFDVRAGMLGRPFFLGVAAGAGVAF